MIPARVPTPFRPLVAATLLCATAAPATAQVWETAWTNPGDPKYVQLDYPVVFVANTGHAGPIDETPVHLGLDVISANNPAAHGPGGGLWVLLPDSGDVVKLFPLPVHESAPGLIDTPVGSLADGAVVEPNISEDGTKVYFAWFHDQEWKKDGGGWQEMRLSYKGADLYVLDLAPLIADNSTDPSTLAIQRLTTTDYGGANPKANVQESGSSKYGQAMNPTLAQGTSVDYWGTVDMHAHEMRTQNGLELVWVSNRARVLNSNKHLGDANHNFNLYKADILPDGSLGPVEQFQYYTTTSALSPIPIRDGTAFSYQSSTEMFRRWDIQTVSSVGKWGPLIGYAHASELFHLGTMVTLEVMGELVDHFIGVKYYNLNDGGFGQLHELAMSDAGINEFVPASTFGTNPLQLTTLLTEGAISQDAPSPQVLVDDELVYIGKFSCARGGRIGGEYLMSYTPTSANRWIFDADGNKGVYEAYIAFRPNLRSFEPHEPVNPSLGTGLYTVVRDDTDAYDLLWPTPVLSWMERHGEPQQRFTQSIVDATTPILRGEPYAQVGTSAIYNTDVRPYDCYLHNTGVTPWNPTSETANEEIKLAQNLEGLRYVQDQNDFCQYLQPETVLGIGINLTSNQVDLPALHTDAYTTDYNDETNPNGRKEAAELLGVYSVAEENISDYSFQARIPADSPFEFHLLDSKYGMKLVDVRSWHSLKPRESRTDCGGCHQHEAGFGIPFEDKEAASKPALDMTTETKYVAYDADCKPSLTVINDPTLQLFEWKDDVWPGFDQHCSSCHDANVSSDGAALDALSYTDEESAYDTLLARDYANTVQGALGSSAFWAAYGERTDGRDNTLPEYQANYAAGNWGYQFSSIHATAPGLCASSNPEWAEWVRTFGQWIDNHCPRDTGDSSKGYKFDRFHPTVDFGLSLAPVGLRFGYWDNEGAVSLDFQLNDAPVASVADLPNGSFVIGLPAILAGDRIKVIATDEAGNRQVKEKTLLQVAEEFLNELGL